MNQCKGLTKHGIRCKHRQINAFCSLHDKPKAVPIHVKINGVDFKAWEFMPGYSRLYKTIPYDTDVQAFDSWFGDNFIPSENTHRFSVLKPMRLLDLSKKKYINAFRKVLNASDTSNWDCAINPHCKKDSVADSLCNNILSQSGLHGYMTSTPENTSAFLTMTCFQPDIMKIIPNDF